MDSGVGDVMATWELVNGSHSLGPRDGLWIIGLLSIRSGFFDRGPHVKHVCTHCRKQKLDTGTVAQVTNRTSDQGCGQYD